jgi:uncharacterized membrane protein YhaH (DUF805 family)
VGELLKRYFAFSGRIGRGRYWRLTLLYLLADGLGSALFITIGIMTGAGPGDAIAFVAVPIFMIFMVAISVVIASVGVRRLHDRGKPGWWLLLYYAGPLWVLPASDWHGGGLVLPLAALGVLICGLIDLGGQPADLGTNAYGPNPLGETP